MLGQLESAAIAVTLPNEAKLSHGGADMEHINSGPNVNGMSISNRTIDHGEPSTSTSMQPVSHSIVDLSAVNTNATKLKSNEPNAEPIIIDEDKSDDDVILVDDPQPKLAASNIIEVDTIDENLSPQTLQQIAYEYSHNEMGTTAMLVVRPWMNHDTARKSCINAISQYAMYKCMLEKCHFATNASKLFRKHMEMHEQVIDYYQQKKLLIGDTHQRLIKFRECAYCPFKAEANDQFIEHVERAHRSSILQCAHCYYRSIEVDNMLLHRNAYHPSSYEAILLCGEKRGFQPHDEDILKNANRNVKKIRCGQNQGRQKGP